MRGAFAGRWIGREGFARGLIAHYKQRLGVLPGLVETCDGGHGMPCLYKDCLWIVVCALGIRLGFFCWLQGFCFQNFAALLDYVEAVYIQVR